MRRIVTASSEYELSAFDGLGLDDVELDDCLTFLLGFVQSCARAAADARATAHDSAMSDAQWWAANGPLLARVFDEHTYPTAARVGAAADAAHGSAYNPEHVYQFGLQRVLDGVATLIDSRPPRTQDAASHAHVARLTRTSFRSGPQVVRADVGDRDRHVPG